MFHVLTCDVIYVFMIWLMFVPHVLCSSCSVITLSVFCMFTCFVYIAFFALLWYMCWHVLFFMCLYSMCSICKLKLYFVRFIVHIKQLLIMESKDIYLSASKLLFISGSDVSPRLSDSCDWHVWPPASGWVCHRAEGIPTKPVKDHCCRHTEQGQSKEVKV